ncbi:Protein bir1 [Ceratocystis platani]|uniref:Protein bir1 n=1 Tax=Ceratocystis fimbriata f. sp. platani TaxID=88771 RepID=A0A0F8CR39_CERFI|nr:Protein bir1 [Ceratocystis platani]
MVCHEDFVTYDARLASFTNPKKRAITANGRAGKIMRWPHGSIRPEDMAAAGMFFDPATTNPDHTICFHCGKGLDGWENGDNPFDEHLTHSRSCGWAILKAVEFGVDSLALDGWEPGDKPINEHESRSASCPVILALKRNKKSRTKNSTLGNTSLLSLQSNATYMSEQPSMDIVAEPEDSVMTTTSTTSKKPTRAKKSTTTTKGRKAKAKKEESAEPEPMDAEQDNQLEPEPGLVLLPAPIPAPAPAPRKRATVNKRTSEAMEDSAMTEAEAPAPKKKTRGRAVSPAATSLTEDIPLLQVEPPTKKSGNRKAAPRQSTRSSRERESSNASFMSAISTTQTQSMLEDIPDDEEIDKQLEADLERFTDHEDLSADSDSERRSRSRVESYQPAQTAQVQEVKSPVRDVPSNYAMFDPSPAVFEQDVEAEMKAMEVEMRASRAKKIEVKPRYELEPEYEAEPEPGPELQPVPPKKGRKAAASRKVSKTKSAKDTLEPASEAEPSSAVVPMEEQVLPERPAITSNIHQDGDELAGSTNGTSATVIKKTTTVSASSKKSKAKQTNKQKPISDTTDEGQDEPENRPVQIRVASKDSVVTPAAVTEEAVGDTPPPPPPHVSLKIKSKAKQAREPEPEPEAERETGHEPGNFPESQESTPWASIDVDQLFDDFAAGAHGSNTTGKDAEQKEREGGDAALAETAIASSAAWIDLLQADQLSASEKDMTVEQWIHHNAAMAEKKMRQECEAMVSRFESEGSKAMRVLEGLVTE